MSSSCDDEMKLWLRWIWCVLFQKIQSVAYLQRSDALPHPLQKHQEAELLKKMKDGDMNARDVLIEHNLRLVVYIAKRYETNPVMMEDLISIGTIGLIKAVASFDSEKNIKLVTYASRCIENEILMFLRKKNRRKQEVSFDEPLNVDLDGNELLLSDILGTENDEIYKVIEDEIDRDLLVMALDRLSDREKQIMELRFGLTNRGRERTQKEVATMLGISQSYISRLEKKIISRLKKEMKKFV